MSGPSDTKSNSTADASLDATTDGPGAGRTVTLEPNLQDPDGFYEQLLEAHEGLDAEQSFELNARLLMLLANQIGDAAVLSQCIALARQAGQARPPG